MVAEVLFRRDLGEELSQRDLAVLAYTTLPGGTAAPCHATGLFQGGR